MKYIVTLDENDIEEIFIFPKSVNHDVFANSVGRMKNQSHGSWVRITRDPIAAGFTDGTTCWGRSKTLGIDSRPDEDARLISG
ncbi:hypothetical protein [Robertmurraya sp.]|uniref:hypothetical protein n=1 Tax=Robertmurraya sp. TaxID=2837525 RepID=UPI003703B134